MPKHTFFILHTLLALTAASAKEPFRVFNLKDSDTPHEARLVDYSLTSRKIQLELQNNRTLWVPWNQLIEADKLKIQHWIEGEEFKKPTRLKIKTEARKKKVSPEKSMLTMQYTFDNLSAFNFGPIQADFLIFVTDRCRKKTAVIKLPVTLPEIPKGSTAQLNTPEQELRKRYEVITRKVILYDAYGNYAGEETETDKNLIKDERFEGAWLRLTYSNPYGEPTIRDLYYPPDLKNEYSWEACLKKAGLRTTTFLADLENPKTDSAQDCFNMASTYEATAKSKKAFRKAVAYYVKAHQKGYGKTAAFAIGKIYLESPLFNLRKAEVWLNKAGQEGNAQAYSTLAWFFATNARHPELRNGEKAIQYANKALQTHATGEDAELLNILAAALARNEQFYDAVDTQRAAISQLKKEPGYTPEDLKPFQEKEKLYRQFKTYEAPLLSIPTET